MLPHFDWRMRTLRTKISISTLRYRIRQEIKDRVSRHEPLKLVIGAGTIEPIVGQLDTPYANWLMTDFSSLNALQSSDWEFFFPPASIHRILAEHVVEHWTQTQLQTFLKTIRQFLAPDALIRIAVPDGFHPDPLYLEAVRPGGSGPGSDDHKVLYNYQTLKRIAVTENFTCDLMEYFDEQGQFHYTAWNIEDGFVERSEHHDPRNKQRPLSYTSLIVDLRPAQRRVNTHSEIL